MNQIFDDLDKEIETLENFQQILQEVLAYNKSLLDLKYSELTANQKLWLTAFEQSEASLSTDPKELIEKRIYLLHKAKQMFS